MTHDYHDAITRHDGVEAEDIADVVPLTFGEWRHEFGRPPPHPPTLAWQWWLAPIALAAGAVALGLVSFDSALWYSGVFYMASVTLEGYWMAPYLRRHLTKTLADFSAFCQRYADDVEHGVPDVEAFQRAVANEPQQRGPVAVMMRNYLADYTDYCALAAQHKELDGRPLVVETLRACFTQVEESPTSPTAEQNAALRDMAERTAQGEWRFMAPEAGPSHGSAKVAASQSLGMNIRVGLLFGGLLAFLSPYFHALLGIHGWPMLTFIAVATTLVATLGVIRAPSSNAT